MIRQAENNLSNNAKRNEMYHCVSLPQMSSVSNHRRLLSSSTKILYFL